MRYLVYDQKCYDFPWEGNIKLLLQNDFLTVAKLEYMAEFLHIPRTCFFFGNREKIDNITIPVIDHMR